jgi:hypothetical protein
MSSPGNSPLLFRNDTDAAGLHFTDVSNLLPPALDGGTAALALDSDRDSRQELFLATGRGGLLLQADGPSGALIDIADKRGLVVPGGAVAAAAGDLDGNRRPDLLVVAANGSLTAYVTDATAHFSATAMLPAGSGLSGLVLLDLNGDAASEVVLTPTTAGAPVRVLTRQGNADPPVFGLAPAGVPSGAVGSLAPAGAMRAHSRALLLAAPAQTSLILCTADNADGDADGIPDFIEIGSGTDPRRADAKDDPDGDDVPNRLEILFRADPRAADSDRNGIRDTEDLLVGTDFDGDGVVFENDNCTSITNRHQHALADPRHGDFCTVPGGLRTMLVAKGPSGELALLPASEIDSQRFMRDQKGLLPVGQSFKLFRKGGEGFRPLVEFVHPTSGHHAYAVSGGDQQMLLGRHYRMFGPVGYVSGERPIWPEAIQLHRLSRLAPEDDMVTADPDQIATLMRDGYLDHGVIGWVMPDEGRFDGRTIPVVGYEGANRITLHSSRRAGDIPMPNMRSMGVVFHVLREKNGWTVPLWRLRDGDGREALATAENDLSELEREGFVRDGIIGHIFSTRPVQTVEQLRPLFRLVSPSGRVILHATDPVQVATLVRDGFGRVTLIGLVVQAAPRAALPDARDIVTRLTSGLADETERGLAILIALTGNCALERALTGRAETSYEKALVPLGDPLDPDTRDRLLDRLRLWHGLSFADRVGALGPFLPLDPGNCVGPIDDQQVRHEVRNTLNTLQSGPRFGNPVRAPQCLGVPADPRAVSVAQRGRENVSETAPLIDYAVAPRLLGLRADASGSSIDGINDPVSDRLFAYASEHSDLGLPLIGVALGNCSSSSQCSRPRGELCIAGQCRAYPVILPSGTPTFTGTSFWDKVSAKFLFREVDDRGNPGVGPPQGFLVDFVNNFEPVAADLPKRCDPLPPFWDKNLRATASSSGGGPFPSTIYRVQPNEEFLDYASAEVRLPKGKFFAVSMLNQNGSYYRWDEKLPRGLPTDQPGHTIHVCDEARCDPPPFGTTAKCAAVPAQVCSPDAGGIWRTQPRPLASCEDGSCPETPAQFESATVFRTPHNDELPLLVYVFDAGASQFLNTRLHSVACDDETGWDAFGSDEFMFVLGSALSQPPTLPPELGVEEAANGFGAWTSDMDSDDIKFPDVTVSSLAVPFQGFAAGRFPRIGHYGIVLGEDDDSIAQLVIATVLGGAGSAAATYFSPMVGAGVGSLTAGIIAIILATDPDDFLGQTGWTGTIPEVRDRGLKSHDSNPIDLFEMLPGVAGLSREVRGWGVASHPAVDGSVYSSETEVRVCTSNADCGDGVCAFNACVPTSWADPTRPLMANGSPAPGTSGHLQFWRFIGSGARYSVSVTTSVTDVPVR